VRRKRQAVKEKREQNYMGGGSLHPAMPKASRERESVIDANE
jgi:hypothetical protein